MPCSILHGIPAISPWRRSSSHGFPAFHVYNTLHHIWHFRGLIQSPLISSQCPELGPEWAHWYIPSLLHPEFHACSAPQPAQKLQTAACNINILSTDWMWSVFIVSPEKVLILPFLLQTKSTYNLCLWAKWFYGISLCWQNDWNKITFCWQKMWWNVVCEHYEQKSLTKCSLPMGCSNGFNKMNSVCLLFVLRMTCEVFQNPPCQNKK